MHPPSFLIFTLSPPPVPLIFLKDLLDAKALALAQADRLIAQYRCRKAESEVEMSRLRALMHQSEKEAEKSRDLLNTARLDSERLQGTSEHYP